MFLPSVPQGLVFRDQLLHGQVDRSRALTWDTPGDGQETPFALSVLEQVPEKPPPLGVQTTFPGLLLTWIRASAHLDQALLRDLL